MSKQLDLTKESPIALAEVPNYIPKRNGKKAHYSTVYRWATKGVKGRLLDSVLVGGVRYTSVEAVARFLETSSNPPTRTKSKDTNQCDLDAISRALDEAGV